jgi:hypothetical protein
MAGMAFATSEDAGAGPHEGTAELRREAYTMALYVAICLLAELSAVAEHAGTKDAHVLAIVWGTTIGLALAHWFAYQVSARLVATGSIGQHEVQAAGSELVGAAAVAMLATVPVLLLPTSAEYAVTRLLLAGFIGLVGFKVARSGGAGHGRAIVYGLSVLLVATAVAVVKNLLTGH